MTDFKRLVNEAFVRRFFPGRDAIGVALALTARFPQYGDIPLEPRTIVGVAGDAVYRSIRAPLRPRSTRRWRSTAVRCCRRASTSRCDPRPDRRCC